MTREDIIRMAREAGLKPDGDDWGANTYRKAIEFAALVAAAEREKLKSLYDQIRFALLCCMDIPVDSRYSQLILVLSMLSLPL